MRPVERFGGLSQWSVRCGVCRFHRTSLPLTLVGGKHLDELRRATLSSDGTVHHPEKILKQRQQLVEILVGLRSE